MVQFGKSVIVFFNLSVCTIFGDLQYAVVILGWIEFGDLVIKSVVVFGGQMVRSDCIPEKPFNHIKLILALTKYKNYK